MSPFPRDDYRALGRYHFDRTPVELDLSDNTNQWGAHPAALAVMRSAESNSLARYPDLYADNVRAAAAARFGVPETSIATGAGSDDILDCTYRAAGGGAGDFVSIAAPTFSMATPLARMNGMAARTVPWGEALDDPGLLLQGGPALVYVCRPNNPTGHVAPRAWVDALLDEAGEDGPLVLLDEAYVDFCGDTFVALAAERPRLLVSRTLSKAFGLAGLRVGLAVGAPETVDEVEKARGPYKVGTLASAAGAAALRDEEGWVTRTVGECIENRLRAERLLLERDLDPQPSSANFILFRAPSGNAREDALAIRVRGVAVRPFPGDMPDGSDALRLTIAPMPLLERFFAALDGFLEELGGAANAR